MAAPAAFEFGPYRLDPRTRVLWRGDEVVPLTPKALDLLLALVEKRGEVATKAELFARVWPDVVVGEANLSVTVAAVRKLLGRQADGKDHVETVSRRGYRFAAPLTGPEHAPLSLVVLPFRVAGGRADDPLGLGLAEAVNTRLAGLAGVRVRSAGSVARFVDADASPIDVATQLGADAALDGTVQRQEQRVRVSVFLVPARADVSPWAESFDEPLAHVFELQDAVAERVAQALAARLGSPVAPASAAGPKAHPSLPAWEAYVRGRLFWSRFDPEGVGKAFACFGEAAQLDPGFARPHAGLADAYLLMGFAGVIEPGQAWRLAGECAARALELEPGLAEAHASLGYVRLFAQRDWAGARAALGEAVALRPGASALRLWNGLFLAMQGDLEGARRNVALACEAEPLSPAVHALAAYQHALTGEPEREIELARKAVELAPGHFLAQWSLGSACARQGLAQPAVAAMRRALRLVGGGPLVKCGLARVLAEVGQPGEARALLAELDGHADVHWVSPYQRGLVLAALGEREAALARLEEAWQTHDPWLAVLAVDPGLALLRGEPAFARLLARVFPGGAPARRPAGR